MLSETIELFDFIARTEFELGVLDKDSRKAVKSFLLSPEGGSEISAEDAMLFVEYGTLDIPGKFLLEQILFQAGRILDRELAQLADEILRGKKDRRYVENFLRATALKIRDFARDFISQQAQKETTLSQKAGIETQTPPRVCDFKELSERIDCIVKFRN